MEPLPGEGSVVMGTRWGHTEVPRKEGPAGSGRHHADVAQGASPGTCFTEETLRGHLT